MCVKKYNDSILKKMWRLKALLYHSMQYFPWQGLNMIFLIAFAQAMDLFHCPCADNDKFHSNVNIYPPACRLKQLCPCFRIAWVQYTLIRCTYARFWCFCYSYLIKNNLSRFKTVHIFFRVGFFSPYDSLKAA